MLKIAICDDEAYYLNQIEKYTRENLTKVGAGKVEITTFSSGKELLENEEYLVQCQIIFLDINMQDSNGVEVAHEIKQKYPDIYLIFITAYMDYAIMGYRVEAFRFLIKDNLEDSMRECIPSLLQRMKKDDARLNFVIGNDMVLGEKISLRIKDILYIESLQHKMRYHMVSGKKPIYEKCGSLSDIEKQLARHGFCRIHKSYLVNMKFVENVERYSLYMENGTKLPIPRERYQKVHEEYIKIMGDI